MNRIERILLENKAWASEKVMDDHDFFKRLSNIQTPDLLWIGCSDSRVPANEITGTQPGEIFVHRNVANLVVKDDLNLLTVLEYAVNYLKIKHIIVCGHYGCGGVIAACSNEDFGLINKWLENIKNVRDNYKQELDKIKDEQKMIDRMVELNVIEQVKNISKTATIKKIWESNKSPVIHGWVYSLKDGIIKPVFKMENDINNS